ncbi:glutamine-rich protein 2 isoform X2 [Melanerpes formicivorus]|uniref:glutamine-rich protein 2 isoform X2 n=1 Tax=Melanerpes formicivorus TaxID=211600 RepID=UPI003590260A
MAQVTLSQLLDLAIGTPEIGAVNFPTLHSLLQAILRHLGLLDLTAQEVLVGEQQPAKATPREKGGQGRGTGYRPLAPEDSLQETTSSPQVADMDQMKKKIEANENGISKAMAVSRGLLEEIDGLKAAQSHMEEDIRTIQEALGLGKFQDGTGQLPSLHEQTSLDDDVKNLKERLSLYPAPEEVSNMVRWEVLEDCLVSSKAGGGEGDGEGDVESDGERGEGEGDGERERKKGDRKKGGGGGRGLPAEGSGAQAAPAEPIPSDVDTPQRASSDPELKEAGTQPAPRPSKSTSKRTPGTQPGSLGKQAGVQKAPVTPEKQPAAPSDQTRTSDASAATPGTQPGSPDTKTSTPGTHPGSPGTKTTTPGTHPGSPDIQTTTPGMQPAPAGTQEAGGAGVQPSPPSPEPSLPSAEKVPAEATPGALGTQRDATSLKAGGKASSSTQLAQTGHPGVGTLSPPAQGVEKLLGADHGAVPPAQEPEVQGGGAGSVSAPERYAETVEALRQIGQLTHLYTALKEQVDHLQDTKLEASEAEKLHLLFPEGGQESITSILAGLQGQVASLQGLVSDLQDEKEKIRQLEDALGKMEAAGADASDQSTLKLESTLEEIKQELKELREHQEMTKAMLEQLVTKTSEQLQEQLDKLREMVAGMGQEQAACPMCSTDISVQVAQLLQRYEKLQELVDSFTSQQPVGKMMKQVPGRSQDEELLKHIQATVVHLQGDYEKLSSVTGNLVDDHHQKQKDIEALFQSLERLEKEKVDKEDLLLGIDVKADKSALASKVNRSQFDASMERLNQVIQEMLSRVTGQEQGWHQVQQQLTEELGSKLDRLELGPFRQQLEEHWKSSLEKIRKGSGTEADDAAGIKKQLLNHFHCVSCDRPLNMLVPGPLAATIPSMPSLPSRLTGDLQAILQQEQAQQHSHREQVGEGRYPTVPRHCGGQHTLTQRLQRCQPLHSLPPGTPQPLHATLHAQRNPTELLGQDGHIYRGQQEPPLPEGKEGFQRGKARLPPRQGDTQDTVRLLSRPQSAGPLLGQAGTPSSAEQRPASSHGHLSQASGLFPQV